MSYWIYYIDVCYTSTQKLDITSFQQECFIEMDLTDYKSTFENGKVAVCQEVNLEFLKPFETTLESF